jgi:Trp operon repressor
LSFDYLKGKPKWNSFMDSQVTGNDKHQRPIGKKKDKMIIKDKSLIKEVVQQLQVDASSVSNKVAGGRDSFFERAGLALAVYCKAQETQQEITYLSMMATPEKKEILSLKREVMMEKMHTEMSKVRSEKRKFDMVNVSIPTSVVVEVTQPTMLEASNNTSSSSMSDNENNGNDE